jgi:Tfp pilus assembly protein PilP
MAMNATMKITILLLAATLAWAQSPAGKTTAAQSANQNKSTAVTAKSAAKPKATTKATAKATKIKPVAAKPKPKSPMKPKPDKATAQKPVPEMAPSSTATAIRKRDPFISPVQARIEGMAGACGGGKRCLAVGEIVLRGVVKSPNGMIAVVENSARKTYFLRENDPIYNGFVQKITADSVVFREHVVDNVGRDSQRDVTKTVNAPVV